MLNQTSERLTRLNTKIMKTWEERALKEIDAAIHHQSLALRDSLPEFLDQLATALSTTIDRTEARIKWDEIESTRIGKKHGHERATMYNYTIDQLIFEYHILRQVICDVMEDEEILSPIEREVIVCAIEQSVNDAATQYSKTLSDIQEKFTQTLAHDLRTPITAAKLNAQLFIRTVDVGEKGKAFIKRIATSMDRLDLMINDLLDAGKLRGGQVLQLDFEECDIDEILSKIADENNFLHGNRFNYQSSGQLKGFWNENALIRIIDNLITNAVKFSLPQSPISLNLKSQNDTVEICVHNMGTPIPATEIKILFDQYTRGKSSIGKKGWGLGLAVVKALTEAHGGHVGVTSSAEAGTTFKVFLPLDAVAQPTSNQLQ